MFKHLVQPINIGNMRLRNRMVQPGMGTNLAAADGTVSDSIVAYYERRARGGVGLIITEVCCPEPRGRVIPGELEISNVSFIPGLSRLVAAAHAGGAKIALQLAHGGCYASKSVTGMDPIGPSGVGTALLPNDKPRTMTREEIEDLIQAYAQAAARAKIAGFDAVEIHGAHGYMPLQFLSAYTNRRTDEYGGSLRNRARFALEIIRAIKEVVGPDFPVIYRLSAEEDVPGGITLEEAVQFAKWAEEAGVDAINVSAGTWDSRMETFQKVVSGQESAQGKKLSQGVSIGMWVPPLYVPRGNLVPLAAAIKKNVSIPVIAVGGLTPELAEEVIAKGYADLAAIGRQAIADPDYPNKVLSGKPQEIRRCVRCNECLGSVNSYKGLRCAVNPEAAKEAEPFTGLRPAVQRKRVIVIGGGPGGMEAARVAAMRGHDVTLYEKENELGGNLRLLSIPDFKKDYRDFMKWQMYELVKENVRIICGVEVTPEFVAQKNPDVVIVATGAVPAKPSIPGIDDPNIYWALDVLRGNIPQGRKVLICGAGLVGAEVGMWLAESYGKQVALIDQLPSVVPEVEPMTQMVVRAKLAEYGAEIYVNHYITAVTPNSVQCKVGDKAVTLQGDAVVIALGMKADQTLYEQLRKLSYEGKLSCEVFAIGDAVQARKVIDAVHEGYHVARRI